MKVKIAETFKLGEELHKLKTENEFLPIKVIYFINKNSKILREETKNYLELEKELLEKYGEKSRIINPQVEKIYNEELKKLKTKEEKEALKTKCEIEVYKPKTGKEDIFNKRLQELQNEDLDINFYITNLSSFGEIPIKTNSVDFCMELGLMTE